jgi:hypothetical protein
LYKLRFLPFTTLIAVYDEIFFVDVKTVFGERLHNQVGIRDLLFGAPDS